MHTAAAVEPSAIALGHAARTADRRLDRQPPCVDCRTPSLTWVSILSSSARISSRRSLLRSVVVVSLAVNPLDPDCLLAKSAQGVPHRPWPGLTASAGLLKSAEVRTRWCQLWVSAASRSARSSCRRDHLIILRHERRQYSTFGWELVCVVWVRRLPGGSCGCMRQVFHNFHDLV